MICMTLQERIKQIGEAHASVIGTCYHYFRARVAPPYAIWQEDGAKAYFANNRAAEQAVTGTTDYFTKTEYDPVVDDIQKMLADNAIAWSLNSVQYEEDTGLIHYEWVWEW